MTYVGDGEKRTQKKVKGLDFISKNTANHSSGIYITTKSSSLSHSETGQVLKNTNKRGVLIFKVGV